MTGKCGVSKDQTAWIRLCAAYRPLMNRRPRTYGFLPGALRRRGVLVPHCRFHANALKEGRDNCNYDREDSDQDCDHTHCNLLFV